MARTFHCVLGPSGIVWSSEWRISHQPTNPTEAHGKPCTHPPPHCTWIKQALSARGHLSEHQVIVDQCKQVEQTNSAQTKVEFSTRSPLSAPQPCFLRTGADRLPDRGTSKLSTRKDDKSPFRLFSAILSCLSQSDTPPNTTFNLTSPDCATCSPSAARVLRIRPHRIDTL